MKYFWNQAASLLAVGALLVAIPASAQVPSGAGGHYFHRATMPPGVVGTRQLQRGGPWRHFPLVGYFQPVEVRAPSGSKMALAVNGRFEALQDSLVAGLLIGQVYRLRVTNIPLRAGQEVYPTIEVIDRTYAPHHRAHHFPIMIELAEQDLRLAADGKFVIRVIYLEDPRTAAPSRRDPDRQEWVEVAPGQDPLQLADHLGRPVAILRMGSRSPEDVAEPGMKFLYGCPPLRKLPALK